MKMFEFLCCVVFKKTFSHMYKLCVSLSVTGTSLCIAGYLKKFSDLFIFGCVVMRTVVNGLTQIIYTDKD
jgi:hypothetical protein